MEYLRTFFGLLTGLSLITIATPLFWYSHNFTGFITSFLIGLAGFSLTLSRILIVAHTAMRRKWWVWAGVAVFVFLIFSFLPLWCVKTNVIGKELTYCFYRNFWEFFFT